MQQNTPDRERAEANIPNIPALSQKVPADSPYTNEEWLALVEAPVKIGRAMMAVSPSGAIGMIQEVMALRKAYQDQAILQGTKNSTLLSIRKHLQDQDTVETIWQDAGNAFRDRWDAANVRQTAMTSCQQVVALLRKLPAQDALAYKEFVYATALKVAQAAREGGVMGIGGVAVSAEEKSLLNDISNSLGLQHA